MNPYLTTPSIIKETSEGLSCCAIQDELFRHREVQCVGEINQESVYSLILQLRYLQKQDAEQEITMYINSPGGEVSSGLGLYDVMAAVSAPFGRSASELPPVWPLCCSPPEISGKSSPMRG